MQLTDKDHMLIALLGTNARTPVATLAKKMGLSRTTVQARLERLERGGVIAGYGVRLAESYHATMVRAHILITIAPKTLTQVVTALEKNMAVRELHSVSGPFDLIAVIVAPSIGELDGLIDQIGGLEGVERTSSSIILSSRICR